MRFIAVVSMLLGAVLASPAADGEKEDACCCCDISASAISCTSAIPSSDCVCADVVCPADAPTIWPDALPTPTLPSYVLPRDEKPCCCCNIAKEEIACQMKDEQDCFCAQVICPPSAPTVWVTTGPPLPQYTG